MKIISREQAIKRGLRHFFTGRPCAKGHVAERFVASYGCVECAREGQRARLGCKPRVYLTPEERRLRKLNIGPGRYYKDEAERDAAMARKAERNAAWALDMRRRKAAKRAGKTRYKSGMPCKYGHVGWRSIHGTGLGGHCNECFRLRSARRQNPRYKNMSFAEIDAAIKADKAEYDRIEKLRSEARARGDTQFDPGVPCARGHTAPWTTTRHPKCTVCRLDYMHAWEDGEKGVEWWKNYIASGRHAERNRAYKQSPKGKETTRNWKNNTVKGRESTHKWKTSEAKREYDREYRLRDINRQRKKERERSRQRRMTPGARDNEYNNRFLRRIENALDKSRSDYRLHLAQQALDRYERFLITGKRRGSHIPGFSYAICEEHGVSPTTVRKRMTQQGMSLGEALTSDDRRPIVNKLLAEARKARRMQPLPERVPTGMRTL